MSQKKGEAWLWGALIPSLGGIFFIAWGAQRNDRRALGLGLSFFFGSIIFSSSSAIVSLVWAVQIGAAFATLPLLKSSTAIASPKQSLLEQGKLDINSCSKNDLVQKLNMPIVYANEIDEIRSEGLRFTEFDDLVNLTSIPNDYLAKIKPFLTFKFDYVQEVGDSWRKLNHLSESELVAIGVDLAAAREIVRIRHEQGDYISLVDVKRKTGIPLSRYRHIL